jgi:choline kinase
VLAAGRGSRLGALGDATPKWLLNVAGRTLAERQLEGIARAGASVASVRVVVGHAADAIEAELAAGARDVAIVANPEYAELNNWWSLLRALRELPDDGPIVLLNADLLIEPEHVTAFIEAAAAGAADGLLATDLGKPLTDESMKVSLTAQGTLERIGKVAIEAPAGEYIGMLMACGGVLRRLRAVLEGFVGRSDAVDEWYEGAIGQTAAAGVPWHVWAMAPDAWVEIDDDADLELAQSLAAA